MSSDPNNLGSPGWRFDPLWHSNDFVEPRLGEPDFEDGIEPEAQAMLEQSRPN